MEALGDGIALRTLGLHLRFDTSKLALGVRARPFDTAAQPMFFGRRERLRHVVSVLPSQGSPPLCDADFGRSRHACHRGDCVGSRHRRIADARGLETNHSAVPDAIEVVEFAYEVVAELPMQGFDLEFGEPLLPLGITVFKSRMELATHPVRFSVEVGYPLRKHTQLAR